jgi:hypothetical protein
MAISQQTVVTNPVKAVWQDVQQEAAHELADFDAHDFMLAPGAFSIVLPADADMGLVDIEQTTVGDRDPMGVAGQVSQDLLRTGEDLLGIDDPLGCAQRRDHAGELLCSLEVCEIAKELEFACLECRHQALKE